MAKSKNDNLHKAKDNKQDEFYTRLEDIENELRHYKEHFKGKIVLCNCDDPFESNFVKYFILNFEVLGLKKLIATSYATSQIVGTQLSLFDGEEEDMDNKRKPYKIEVTKVVDENGDGAIDLEDFKATLRKNKPKRLKGDGDFRSTECIELLKQADIVCTNPPFSLFREYMKVLIEYEKQFLIIGSQNNITYKEIFPLIKDNKLWLGYKSGDMAFTVPDSYEPRETRYWQDESGQKWRSLGNICWYTNLDVQKRHEDMVLYKSYNAEEYPLFDNYNAINVNKVSDIPYDYLGTMGVPITFLDKYNPDQFEIEGITLGNTVDYPMTRLYNNAIQHNKNGSTQGGSKVNTRAALLVTNKPKDVVYYTADEVDGYLLSVYPRILIRRKDASADAD